jgi:hypothetical protein
MADWLDELLKGASHRSPASRSPASQLPVTRTELESIVQALAERLARLEARIARLEQRK